MHSVLTNMIPEYSNDARNALGVMTANAYRLIVYFEDAGKEPLYEEIVKRLAVDAHDIRVICLNGKRSLLTHREALENKRFQKKTLYVLDKDFDDLLKRKRRFKNVYYLSQYSIENFFLEEEAVAQIAREEKPGIQSIRDLLGINAFLTNIYPEFRKLAALYVLAQQYNLPIANTSEPIQRRSIDRRPWALCSQKIDAYLTEISTALLASGVVSDIDSFNDLLRNKMNLLQIPHDVPGKQLLDLVRAHISNTINARGLSSESFCFRLARTCRFEALESLSTQLNERLALAS